MKRKLVSLALACIMVIMTFTAAVPVFAEGDEVLTAPRNEGNWNDIALEDTDKTWYGDGSASTFTIRTVREFIYFCQISDSGNFSGKTFQITCDLDLGDYYFTPISATKKDFRGKLIGAKDGVTGASITISNMFVNGAGRSAFIGTSNGITLHNLTFENCHVTGNGGNVAIVCGVAVEGTNKLQNVNINNCTVTQTAADSGGIGFVFGQVTTLKPSSWIQVEVTKCTISNSTITAAGTKVGAIIGVVTGGTLGEYDVTVNISNVSMTNTTITGNGNDTTVAGCVGGIIGHHNAISTNGTSLNSISISDCTLNAPNGVASMVVAYAQSEVNIKGLVLSDNEIDSTGNTVGGIIGSAGNAITISGVNINNQTISAKGYLGGVIGVLSTTTSTIDNVSIIGGNISHTAKTNALVGGLIGQANANLISLVNNTVNGLTIVSPAGATRVGSLVGYINGGKAVTMINCTANVASDTHTLEFCGQVNANGQATYLTLDAPTLLDGASIRTTAGSNGIRFTSTVNTESLETAKTDGLITAYSFGTIIARNDKRGENNYFTVASFNADDVADIKAEDGITENENGYMFNSAVTGFTTEFKSIEFAARSYVEITLANGNMVRIYSDFDAEKNVRSMEYVANKALNDVTDAADEDEPFPHKYKVTFKNSNTDGTAFEEMAGTFYSRYTAAQCEILKIWASDSN